MNGFGGDGTGHKDLWSHTKKVVSQTPHRRPVRWAALFHDVGKVPTFSRASGKVTFHGHEAASARLFNQAAQRSGLDDAFRRHVRFLVRHLGRFEGYQADWTDSAVRRLHRDCAEHFDDLLMLSCADVTTKYDHKRAAHRARVAELAERAKAIAEADAALPPLPKGLGTIVIERLALGPGPEVRRVMTRLEQAVAADELPARAQPEVYVDWLLRENEGTR